MLKVLDKLDSAEGLRPKTGRGFGDMIPGVVRREASFCCLSRSREEASSARLMEAICSLVAFFLLAFASISRSSSVAN